MIRDDGRAAASASDLVVTHRRYVSYENAHYNGNLVDAGFTMRLFGEIATDLCIQLDGDEGLLAAYEHVQFRSPVYCGDVIEVSGHVESLGTRSRRLQLTCIVISRAAADHGGSAATLLAPPLMATEATAIVVVARQPTTRDGSTEI